MSRAVRAGMFGLAAAGVLTLTVPAVASAQPDPDPPANAECGFLSAVVCQVVVPVGPVEILPNGLGLPPGPPLPAIP